MFCTQVAILALAALVTTHPVHDAGRRLQAVEARVALANTNRTLKDCAPYLAAQGVNVRAMERRKATFNAHRAAWGRPWDTPHTMNGESNTLSGYPWGDCPKEHVRSDLKASEQDAPSIFVVADIQLINVETCYPMADVWAEIWSCNATGVHPVVQSEKNPWNWCPIPYGARGLKNTALHSLQKSDADGVVQFRDTIPVHWSRTHHQHIVVRNNATILPNGILAGGESVSHVGQLSWDHSLLDEIENKAPQTFNSEDFVFRRQETAGNDSGLIIPYASFGDRITFEILASVVIGVDPSTSYTAQNYSASTEGRGIAVGSIGESSGAH